MPKTANQIQDIAAQMLDYKVDDLMLLFDEANGPITMPVAEAHIYASAIARGLVELAPAAYRCKVVAYTMTAAGVARRQALLGRAAASAYPAEKSPAAGSPTRLRGGNSVDLWDPSIAAALARQEEKLDEALGMLRALTAPHRVSWKRNQRLR